MNTDIKGRLYIGLIFSLILVISVGIVSLTTFEKEERQEELLKKTYRVVNQLEIVERTLIDMETGRRGFRATNDKKFLQPYNEGVQTIEPAYQKLLSLVNDDGVEQSHAITLKSEINDILEFWINMGVDASTYTRLNLSEIGNAEKSKMDLLRAHISQMKSVENTILKEREDANANSLSRARWELIVCTLVILVTVSALIIQMLRVYKSRTKAEADLQKSYLELQQQKEILESQQEELRQTNEELNLHAERMSNSEKELRTQEEELRNMNVELEERNEAVETARHALAIKAKQLEEASKYKSEFLANMSHELRTPLNSVLILAKLLSDNTDHNLTEKQVAHAKIIHKSGSDLLRLINNILDLSKIEAGKVEVYVDTILTREIAEDIQQLFTVVAEEKEIDFAITFEAGVPEVIRTDKQKVEQVLKNLLSNAFKFTDSKGRVTLAFKSIMDNDVPQISMCVSDTGIGIPAKQQQVIFGAFQQADGATNRKFGGTGLGLSITKELVRLLNGKINVESKPDKGSVFTVSIPTINKAVANTITKKKATVYNTALPDNITEQTLVADDRNRINKDDKVMLIIEDDQDFATLIRGFASKKGYKTIIALQGDEGLLCAKKYHPSAIILDMGLPVIDGNTLLQTFKKDPALKSIPVHIISASEDIKFGNSGALAFLKKPIDRQNIDKAFTLIEEYIHSSVKRVLLLSTEDMKNEVLGLLVEEKNYDIKCDVVASVTEALSKLTSLRYDCIIADIRNDVEKGILELRFMYEQLLPQRIPTIIYLDEDISETNEVRLKKMANVIVRKSTLSDTRLMDELELFLYKVEGDTDNAGLKQIISSSDPHLQKKKVLLVDDDMRNVFALTAALEHEQMEIFSASDGKEAINMLSTNKHIDIVLMDIMMPEMDGYEALRIIRNDLHLTDLPVIALTAKAMSGDKEKCIEAGASDYITKPVDTQKLVSLMRVWLA